MMVLPVALRVIRPPPRGVRNRGVRLLDDAAAVGRQREAGQAERGDSRSMLVSLTNEICCLLSALGAEKEMEPADVVACIVENNAAVAVAIAAGFEAEGGGPGGDDRRGLRDVAPGGQRQIAAEIPLKAKPAAVLKLMEVFSNSTVRF